MVAGYAPPLTGPRIVTAPDCNPIRSPDGNWVTDLWLVPNTGLRLELRDTYKALETLAQRDVSDLSESDLEIFFKWWKNFATFVHELHDIEERVIHGWLADELGYKSENLNAHVHLLLEMNAISNIKLTIGRSSPATVVKSLITKLEDFGKRLLILRQRKESELAAEIRTLHNVDKWETRVENDYWKAVGRSKGYAGAVYLRGVLWAANHQTYWKTVGILVEPRILKLRQRVTVLRVSTFLKPHKNALKPLIPQKGDEGEQESEEERLFFSFA